MCEFLGIELTEHQAYIIFCVLTLISALGAVIGQLMTIIASRKDRIDTEIAGMYIVAISLLGFIVFSLLGGCFK